MQGKTQLYVYQTGSGSVTIILETSLFKCTFCAFQGPPGCGKTMIAKATAREAGARFINLDVSQITDKWYGESQKLANAIFTLATKLSPCIIFIDEIDSLLRVRDSHDHEATAMVKAQFMQMWDGLETNSSATVMVLGATNR